MKSKMADYGIAILENPNFTQCEKGLLGLAKSLTEKWQMTENKLEFNNKKSLSEKENEIRYSPFPQREPIEETRR
jgi:hypothetical protein